MSNFDQLVAAFNAGQQIARGLKRARTGMYTDEKSYAPPNYTPSGFKPVPRRRRRKQRKLSSLAKRTMGSNMRTVVRKNRKKSRRQRRRVKAFNRFKKKVRAAQAYDYPMEVARADSYYNFTASNDVSFFVSAFSGDTNCNLSAGAYGRLRYLQDIWENTDNAGIANEYRTGWIKSVSNYEVHNPNNFAIEFVYYVYCPHKGGQPDILQGVNATKSVNYSSLTDMTNTFTEEPTFSYTAGGSTGQGGMSTLEAPSWFYIGQLPGSFRTRYKIRMKKKGVIAPGETVKFVFKDKPTKHAHDQQNPEAESPDLHQAHQWYPFWRFVAPFSNTSVGDADAGRPEFDVTWRHYMVDYFRRKDNPTTPEGHQHVVTNSETTCIRDISGADATVPTNIDMEAPDQN